MTRTLKIWGLMDKGTKEVDLTDLYEQEKDASDMAHRWQTVVPVTLSWEDGTDAK